VRGIDGEILDVKAGEEQEQTGSDMSGDKGKFIMCVVWQQQQRQKDTSKRNLTWFEIFNHSSSRKSVEFDFKLSLPRKRMT
jgi:hypothetical protein